MSPFSHEPVLVSLLLQYLDLKPGQVVLDGTVGLGGHALALAPRIAPGGTYIGLDVDSSLLSRTRERVATVGGVTFHIDAASYVDFPNVVEKLGIATVDAILLDVGANSVQLDDATRGFSFDRDGPLDMRFNRDQRKSALDLVNGLSEGELADLFYEAGQEQHSRKIARKLCQVRHFGRITTTRALAAAVESLFGPGGLRAAGRVHPATRVFQALRIAVNGELENLENVLPIAAEHLSVGGKLAVICFHSLEDGIVKRFMRAGREIGLKELTKKPEIADEAERQANPRSRSAKLRVAQRVEADA